jgi:hypothetical protein
MMEPHTKMLGEETEDAQAFIDAQSSGILELTYISSFHQSANERM